MPLHLYLLHATNPNLDLCDPSHATRSRLHQITKLPSQEMVHSSVILCCCLRSPLYSLELLLRLQHTSHSQSNALVHTVIHNLRGALPNSPRQIQSRRSMDRHEFTFQTMSTATGILPARTRAIAVVSVIISVFYSGFLVAGIGGATATGTRLDILFISIIVINLAWTMQVIKNVQEVAISKAIYVYFSRDDLMNACDALGVTLKKQLGSVCIGSTLVPLIVLFRGTIRCCNRDIYASTPGCNWIANHIILGGNRYGFVHVGAHNKGLRQASSDTWRRFRTIPEFEQLIDFDITSSICFFSAMGIGAIAALTAGVWELLIDKDHYFELTIYAFIIGYFVGRVSSAWLQACVMGYYVAYSEDPQNDRFDDTIPQRIERQKIEKAKREVEDNRVLQEDDDVPTHV
ncbi:unnamed protein product [Arabidopsis thaliana]|uniref:Choline transporter-like protein n=1 Tax=Arabidopsis thaliana TaxID=3702 RepID=A0A7G2FDC7_ARATH|nr:unnamed protein product [Arabidopsis thaliana]